MCMGSGPKPTPPPPPPAPEKAPTVADDAVRAVRGDEKRRAQLAAGRASTILTGSTGLAGEAPTIAKTLLGA